MIGRKKLSEIRQELQQALTATGDDPLRWLEEHMANPMRSESAASEDHEVLQSLRRLVESKETMKRRKKRVSAKK